MRASVQTDRPAAAQPVFDEVTDAVQEPAIRRARSGEAESLTALAVRSKAHWGYDADFLDEVRELLTFAERDLVDELNRPGSVGDFGSAPVSVESRF